MKPLLLLCLPALLASSAACDKYSYVNLHMKLDPTTGWTSERAFSINRTEIVVSGADMGIYGLPQPTPLAMSTLELGWWQYSTLQEGTLTFDLSSKDGQFRELGTGTVDVDIVPGQATDAEVTIRCTTTILHGDGSPFCQGQ